MQDGGGVPEEHLLGPENRPVVVAQTGFTDEAGGNLVMIFDVTVGHPVVIVVTGSTRTERFTDVEKLYERTKNALQ
jgi:D-alanyl-D-alanine carboxypeptidase